MINRHKIISLLIITAVASFIYSSLSYSRETKGVNNSHISRLIGATLQMHVSKNALTPQIGAETMTNYIELLDPTRSFFLESDVNEAYANKIRFPLAYQKGEWAFVTNIFSVFISRVKQQHTNAITYLTSRGFTIDNSRAIITDTKKMPHPKTSREALNNLEDILQYQVAYLVSIGEPLTNALHKVVKRRERLLKRYLELTPEKQYALFVNAFCRALDPHTAYLTKDDVEDFEIGMALSLEGIGALLSSPEGITEIKSLTPGGPAEKSGLLKPGDKIVAVAQGEDGEFVDIIDMDLRDVVKKIRGKKGTVVRLRIVRKAEKGTERKEIALTRDKVKLEDQAPRLEYVTVSRTNDTGTAGEYTIAVIDLPSFYLDPESRQLFGDYSRSAVADVTRLLKSCQTANVDGVILDLQRNGGGLLDEAVYTAGLFLKKGNIVMARDRTKFIKVLPDTNGDLNYNGPLIITVSRATASGAEIVAGALKDYKRALIVGSDHTFGKGTIQQIVPLSENLGALKITSGEYFIASGNSPQNNGVHADIVVPSELSALEIGERYQPSTLPAPTAPPVLSPPAKIGAGKEGWRQITEKEIQNLESFSKKRIKVSQVFSKIR
jgi:carboxyl-terminal processing protease